MKIGVAQINTIVGDFAHNLSRIRYYTEQAKVQGADLVVFPELCIPGYPPLDFLEKYDFIKKNLEALDDLIRSVSGIGVIVGYIDQNPADEGNRLFNAAVLFEDGRVVSQCVKRLLPTYDVFDERRFFEPGRTSIPVDYKGIRLGLTVCEDIWSVTDAVRGWSYDIDPVATLAEAGIDLLVNMSASPYHMGKIDFKSRALSTIAAKYRVPLVYSNLVGGNDDLLFDGVSLAFDETGSLIARCAEFEEDLVIFDPAAPPKASAIRSAAASPLESVYRALVLGTRDYVKKCGFSTVVVGLSGGVDSALTACIAADALGSENVTLIFMPSRYTAEENAEDTRILAERLGCTYLVMPIDSIYHTFLSLIPPEEEEPGITEQNFQARIRGTILMGYSNKHGCLVLSTGNKSELAVGYCTLYGDMSGGLAVISDVPKTGVYKLCRYVNQNRGWIPERILTKPPSAELKPDQTDQDELPDYDRLDAVLTGYIEELKSADELIREGHDPEIVNDIITRIHRNEYKRKQAAPGLRVTSKAFGYGRRYPIAQRYRPFSE